MSAPLSHLLPFKYLLPDSPYYGHSIELFKLVYARRRSDALRHVQALLEKGISIKAMYQEMFTPLLYEVGHLWENDKFSVAEEHHFTANIQFLMSYLYSTLTPNAQLDGRMMAVCVGDELHEVGLRMISDFYEIEGWDVLYLGSNMPKLSFIRSVEEFQPHIFCISYTMDWHFSELKRWITSAQRVLKQPARFVVGGYGIKLRSTEISELGVILYDGDITQLLSDSKRFLRTWKE